MTSTSQAEVEVSCHSMWPLDTGPEAEVQRARTWAQSSWKGGVKIVVGGFKVIHQIFVIGESGWDMV
jgi:hypothetical protein